MVLKSVNKELKVVSIVMMATDGFLVSPTGCKARYVSIEHDSQERNRHTGHAASHPVRLPTMTIVPDLRCRIWGRIEFVTFMTPNTLVWNCCIAARALRVFANR